MKLILLVGAPASGKSTWAANFTSTRPNFAIIASDTIRRELYGEEETQGDPKEVFGIVRQRVEENLAAGNHVIIDATNISRKDRRTYFPLAKKYGATVEARVFAISYEECVRRNANRARVVPETAIHRMFCRFEPPVKGEGFDTILVVRDNDYTNDSAELFRKFATFGPQHNHHHSLTLKDHCDAAYSIVREMGGDTSCRKAALFHDVGKVYTQTFDDAGEAHYYQHANFGSLQALATKGVDYKGAILIGYHMMMYQETALPKLKKLLGESLFADLEMIHIADRRAH